jgi:hypothetical protein
MVVIIAAVALEGSYKDVFFAVCVSIFTIIPILFFLSRQQVRPFFEIFYF